MKKDIVLKGKRVLTTIAKEVEHHTITKKSIQTIIADLRDTLSATKKGVGLAAPQIGESVRIFVISPKAMQIEHGEELENTNNSTSYPTVFINPVIINKSKDSKKMQEGCLSIPGIVGDVRRSSRVTVEAWDENGDAFTLSAKGFIAQIIQHENDHLDGILFDTKATNLREI